MRGSAVCWVVGRMGVVPPDGIAALEGYIKCENGKWIMSKKMERTLIHMLALPAQLLKSFARSLREKKRSSTILMFINTS